MLQNLYFLIKTLTLRKNDIKILLKGDRLYVRTD